MHLLDSPFACRNRVIRCSWLFHLEDDLIAAIVLSETFPWEYTLLGTQNPPVCQTESFSRADVRNWARGCSFDSLLLVLSKLALCSSHRISLCLSFCTSLIWILLQNLFPSSGAFAWIGPLRLDIRLIHCRGQIGRYLLYDVIWSNLIALFPCTAFLWSMMRRNHGELKEHVIWNMSLASGPDWKCNQILFMNSCRVSSIQWQSRDME